MPGIRRPFRWASTGILERIGEDITSVVRFLKSVQAFSASVAEFLTSLTQVEILQGQLYDVKLNGTSSAQNFPHGLGRPYRGGFLVGNGSLVASTTLIVVSGARALAAGTDASRVFTVVPTTAHDGRYLVWVF